MKEIRLELRDGIWHAEMLVDGKPDMEIVELYNTHIIATPYFLPTTFDQVAQELSIRQPHVKITQSSETALTSLPPRLRSSYDTEDLTRH